MDFGALFAILFVLIFLGVIIGSIVYDHRMSQLRVEQARDLAASRGWKFSPAPQFDPTHAAKLPYTLAYTMSVAEGVLYTLSGQTDGVNWELTSVKAKTAGRSRVPPTLRWRSPDSTLPGELVFIAPAPPGGIPAGFNIGSGLNKLAWGFFLSVYGVSDTNGLAERGLGSQSFREKFMLFSRSEEAARRVLASAVENQLLNWPQSKNPLSAPMITADASGVTVRLSSDDANSEGEFAQRAVSLGAAVVNAIR